MRDRPNVVLCFAAFIAILIVFTIAMVIKRNFDRDSTRKIVEVSPTEILIIKGKIDDADCSLSLAVALKNATDQDFINLLPKVQNDFRNAVVYVFLSKEHAVYPKTAFGGFMDNKNLSRVVGVVTCNINGYQEVVRYEPNMLTGKPRVLLSKSARN
jgi:hypothetical protein